MKCEDCEHWIVRRATVYGDGSEIVKWQSKSGKGQCGSLGIEVDHDFGCNRFLKTEGDHTELTTKTRHPWEHWVMVTCPECGGGETGNPGGSGHRCAGTGLVRLYDDGYVGDEQTRLHPKQKEVAPPPGCPHCAARIDSNWKHCPSCGNKLWAQAETEVVNDILAGLPPQDPQKNASDVRHRQAFGGGDTV